MQFPSVSSFSPHVSCHSAFSAPSTNKTRAATLMMLKFMRTWCWVAFVAGFHKAALCALCSLLFCCCFLLNFFCPPISLEHLCVWPTSQCLFLKAPALVSWDSSLSPGQTLWPFFSGELRGRDGQEVVWEGGEKVSCGLRSCNAREAFPSDAWGVLVAANSMCSLLVNGFQPTELMITFFSVFLGNGLQTGPESSGFPFTYNHGHTYAGSGRGSGRGPVNPAPANSVQPLPPAVSNGRDPRRAFKRWLCQMWLYSLLKLYTLLEHLLHFYL